MDQFASVDWDIVPKDGYDYDWVKNEIDEVKAFIKRPNKNGETFQHILRAWMKDVLEIDAGVIVKVFDINSYDFDNIEPKSGAPMLKPLGQRNLTELYVRDGACLKFGSMIETDLGFIPIGKIVNDKIKCNVKSFNRETGEIEWKPITNWFNNGISTDWITLKAKTNGKFRSLTCTPNHHIMQEFGNGMGYVEASQLQVGDTIFTQQEKLSSDQHQIILGSLLGDASLSCGGSDHSKYKLSETHCIKQGNYLIWKSEMLSPLGIRIDNFLSSYGKGYEPTEKVRMSTGASIIFEDYYNLKYPKIVPEIVDDLTELGLAVWIQDDGYFNKGAYSISCGDIAIETLNEIATRLKDKFNITFKVRRGAKESLLEVGRLEGQKLKDLIKPFVHPSMSYKVNSEVCGQDLDTLSKETTTEIIETEIYEKSTYQYYDARYDIEIADNHNFFAQGLLVSNSFLKEIDKFGFLKGYWQYSYQIPAHPMWFNRDEIVYSVEHPRSMSCYGYARTQAILDVIKSLHYSTLYNKKFFEETAIPDGALSLLDTNEMEMQAFRNYWNNEFKAQPHKLAVINKDIKWQPFAVSQRELEFLETQKQYFNWAISMFGLTPSELGITEDVNRATGATQAEVAKRKGIRPFLKLFEVYMNEGIIPEWQHEGIEFQFVYDDPAEKAARLANWKTELEMGVKTPNEVRIEMGMEPIEGGDLTNTQRIVAQSQVAFSGPETEEGREDAREDNESPDYKETVDREEGNQRKDEYDETKRKVQNPYGDSNRPVGNFKSAPDQLKIGIEVEREHQASLKLTDQEVEQIARDHLAEDPEYYTKLQTVEGKSAKLDRQRYGIVSGAAISQEDADQIKRDREQMLRDQAERHSKIECPKCGKAGGMETHFGYWICNLCGQRTNKSASENSAKGYVMPVGQYYNDQPISQPNRPSGANFQPQNPKPTNHFPRDSSLRTQPPRNEDAYPSRLGDSYADPSKHTFRQDKDQIHCPMCGQPTLTYIQALEGVTHDVRCTNCGSRFNQEDILNAKLLEETSNVLHAHNATEPVSIPAWKPKGYMTKEADDMDMDAKSFAGFDIGKSIQHIDRYATSKEYFNLLHDYLGDLKKKNIKDIIDELIGGMKDGLGMKEIARKIDTHIGNRDRSELIARTEVIRLSNEGNLQRMAESGAIKAEFIAAPEDGRLCRKCAELDGKMFSVKEARGVVPVHPRCRCTFTERYD